MIDKKIIENRISETTPTKITKIDIVLKIVKGPFVFVRFNHAILQSM